MGDVNKPNDEVSQSAQQPQTPSTGMMHNAEAIDFTLATETAESPDTIITAQVPEPISSTVEVETPEQSSESERAESTVCLKEIESSQARELEVHIDLEPEDTSSVREDQHSDDSATPGLSDSIDLQLHENSNDVISSSPQQMEPQPPTELVPPQFDAPPNMFSFVDDAGASLFASIEAGPESDRLSHAPDHILQVPEMHRMPSLNPNTADADNLRGVSENCGIAVSEAVITPGPDTINDPQTQEGSLENVEEEEQQQLLSEAFDQCGSGESISYALPVDDFSPVLLQESQLAPPSPVGPTENDSHDEVVQVGRVDASKMGEVDNPLQKCGRHTVITGHLPESNPFSIGANLLGVKMVSAKLGDGGPGEMRRQEAFRRDLHEFLVELGHPNYKIPVIGGGPLDLYALAREVLLLGGVANVVRKRAFRIVGQQLELPKSCTSAAFVLKNAYTKLLFHYERKLVFDIYPKNPTRNVNIKLMVTADKAREKLEARGRSNGSSSVRRRSEDRKRRLAMPPSHLELGRQYMMPDNTLSIETAGAHSNGTGYEDLLAVRAEEMSPMKRARYMQTPMHDDSSAAAVAASAAVAVDDVIMGGSAGILSVPPSLGAADSVQAAMAAEFDLQPEYYMSLVATQPPPSSSNYELPEWAKIAVQEQNYQAFVDAAQALDEKREGENPFSFDKAPPPADLGASFADPRIGPQELLASGRLHALM